ncbi:MAG TPA: OFA family MFS transporter [Bryobacteraceae bacterium]|jgi:OFA family oxalate/formate antiporter-like MFS transporter|nr:OFA family MFS transporter [Bryobacteraceae bacterium]
MTSSPAKSAAEPDTVGGNRARHAIIAIFMQMMITVVYSWSVFRVPLAVLHGWSKDQTIMPNRYSLIMVAAGAVVGGMWQDRKGPRLVASVGGSLLALGSLISMFYGDTLAGLVIGYGFVGGFGGGFAYVTPIANLVKWFPDKRGLMVGLAVMGSGVSTLFWSPLIETLIGHNPAAYHDTIPRTFMVMSTLFLFTIVGAAQLFRDPPPGWKPKGWTPPVQTTSHKATAGQMLRTWQFYVLWIVFFLGTSVGTTAIGQASPLIQEVAGKNLPITIGLAIGIMGIANGAGRLIWGSISDRAGRQLTLIAMSAVSILACLGFLRAATGFWGVVAGLCLAAFAYGGYLALMPTFSADFFGQANVGGNYGLLFSAWGICGFYFPHYSESLLDRALKAGNLAGGYKDLYFQLAILAAGVGVLGAFLKSPKIKHLH